MATMAQSLRDRLFHAFGNSHLTELEALLDSAAPTACTTELKDKLRRWIANDTYAVELINILEGNIANASQRLNELLRVALADHECGDDFVTLLNGMLSSNTPSSTPSHTASSTPSSTPSHTPSSTPSHTVSNTPSSTPSHTVSNTPSHTVSNTPSSTPSHTPSATGT